MGNAAVLEPPAVSPPVSSTLQMNIRMDASLKREGDAALAEAGFTPTEAVRAIWEFARKNKRNPQAIREQLGQVDEGPSEEEMAERQRKIDSMHTIHKMIADFYEERGIDPAKSELNTLSYKELRELAYDEMLEEKGWVL